MQISDDQIMHFCEVTGISILLFQLYFTLFLIKNVGATPEQALSFIEISDGNVEGAIGLFLESGGAWTMSPTQSNSATLTSATAALLQREDSNDQDQPFIDLTDEDIDSSSPSSLGRVPQHSMPISASSSIPRPIPSNFSQFPSSYDSGTSSIGMETDFDFPTSRPLGTMRERLIDDFPIMQTHNTSTSSTRDAFLRTSNIGDIMEDVVSSSNENRLARLFAPPRDIMFSGGDFENARNTARSNDKWIIITLHDPTEFPCQVLNRDLWKDPGVKEVIKSSFIFCQYVVGTPEGSKYRNFYPVDSLPHIAIIDPRTGERVKVWYHAPDSAEFLVDRILTQFYFYKNRFIVVMDFIETHSLSSRPSKNPKKSKMMDSMNEEDQIAVAISESLMDKSEPMSEIEQDQEDLTSSLNLHNTLQASERPEIPPGTEGVTSIQFRLPDGKRVVRKFLKSDSIKLLFQHVKFAVEELRKKPFELMFHREPLSKSIDQSLQEMKLTGVAINVDYL